MSAKLAHDLDTVLHAVRGTGPWMIEDDKTGTFYPRPSAGVISTIARRLGVTRPTIYNYMGHWKTVKDAIEDEREGTLDMAENQLYNEVQRGNITAIIFLLKTRGKERGYIERQELTGKDGEELKAPAYIIENRPDDSG